MHEIAVDPLEVVEHRVVVEPHDPDDREAHDVRRVTGRWFPEGVAEMPVIVGRRDRQHEQRDRNGEHTVAEGFDPPLPHQVTSSPELQLVDGRTTVDRDDLTGDEAAGGTAEVQDHMGDVGAVADHAHGVAGPVVLLRGTASAKRRTPSVPAI